MLPSVHQTMFSRPALCSPLTQYYCACVGCGGRAHIPLCVYRGPRTTVELILSSTFTWVPETKLGSSGLCSKCFYLLCTLTPSFNFQILLWTGAPEATSPTGEGFYWLLPGMVFDSITQQTMLPWQWRSSLYELDHPEASFH